MKNDFIPPYPFSLELKLNFCPAVPEQEQERVWDELLTWLNKRQVYVGGRYYEAYLLTTEHSTLYATDLRKWIAKCRAVSSHYLRPSPWKSTQMSASLRNARLEALFNLQQHVVERMAQATLAMYFLKWTQPPDSKGYKTDNSPIRK